MDPNSLSAASALSWFADFKDLLLVLVGGICAMIGGLLSAWYETRTARRRRMEEIMGEQKVDIYKKALRLASQLGSILIQGAYGDILDFIKKENAWVLENEILLPQKFAENWHSVRNNVLSAQRRAEAQDRMPDGPERDTRIDEVLTIDAFCQQLAQEAENVIRQELGLRPFKIHRPPKEQPPSPGQTLGS